MNDHTMNDVLVFGPSNYDDVVIPVKYNRGHNTWMWVIVIPYSYGEQFLMNLLDYWKRVGENFVVNTHHKDGYIVGFY
jgi:allophanate hydrolase subunit 1